MSATTRSALASLEAAGIERKDYAAAVGDARAHAHLGGRDAREGASFGAVLGDRLSGDFKLTRCAAVAHTVATYFCTPLASALVADNGGLFGAAGTDALAAALDRARGWGGGAAAQAIFYVTVSDDADDSLGHVFMLQVLPDARVQLYQAFIGRYDLSDHLRRSPPMDAAALARFLANLAAVEGGAEGVKRPWTAAMNNAYHENFAVYFQSLDTRGIDRWSAGKTEAGRVAVEHTVVCVLPPHSGTAADLAADAWLEQERALIAPLLRWAVRQA